MKKTIFTLLVSASLLIPGLTSAQLLVFKGSSTDAYIGESRTWRLAWKTILVVDYATGTFGRVDYTTFHGVKHYATETYTNAHLVPIAGPNGKAYTAVTRIPSDCYRQEYPNREGLYFEGQNSSLTVNPAGDTVSFPKTITSGGHGFFYSSVTSEPVLSQGSLLGIFNQTETQARNQAGDTLDSALANYIAYVEGQGYTR